MYNNTTCMIQINDGRIKAYGEYDAIMLILCELNPITSLI